MKILSIETSSEAGSVALWVDHDLIERSSQGAQTHSGWVLPAVSALLGQAGVKLAELDAIAFGAGPGAFTGLRLACGVAQGLALAAARPVVAVGSLEALAWAAGPGLQVVATDARMNEVYFAAFEVRDEELACRLSPRCEPPHEAADVLAEFLRNTPGAWSGSGNGFCAYDGLLASALAAQLSVQNPGRVATAGAVASLASHRLAMGRAMQPADVAPLYVRDKVARTTAERLASGGRA